ncbi:MAG: hypothetical protein KDD44_13400, partial [Bdellovibrionales bacterium]|nr:hypothetical protein [Bdellovibrionales bacterium]
MSALRLGLVAAIAISCVLIGLSYYHYREENRFLRRIVTSHIDRSASASEKMHQALGILRNQVREDPPAPDFLSPAFSFLRPSAKAVLEHGGDCAYRARAFIVLLDRAGVTAGKVALLNDRGEAVHAVALVDTERGQYVVDLLYNFVHEDEGGNPVPLS